MDSTLVTLLPTHLAVAGDDTVRVTLDGDVVSRCLVSFPDLRVVGIS